MKMHPCGTILRFFIFGLCAGFVWLWVWSWFCSVCVFYCFFSKIQKRPSHHYMMWRWKKNCHQISSHVLLNVLFDWILIWKLSQLIMAVSNYSYIYIYRLWLSVDLLQIETQLMIMRNVLTIFPMGASYFRKTTTTVTEKKPHSPQRALNERVVFNWEKIADIKSYMNYDHSMIGCCDWILSIGIERCDQNISTEESHAQRNS